MHFKIDQNQSIRQYRRYLLTQDCQASKYQQRAQYYDNETGMDNVMHADDKNHFESEGKRRSSLQPSNCQRTQDANVFLIFQKNQPNFFVDFVHCWRESDF